MSNAAAKSEQGGQAAQRSAQEVMASPEFRALVKKRWAVSTVLLTLLFVCYYGYILLVALAPDWVSAPVSSAPDAVITRGIPLGVGALFFAWLLTFIYVLWANRSYDPEVSRLKGQLKP